MRPLFIFIKIFLRYPPSPLYDTQHARQGDDEYKFREWHNNTLNEYDTDGEKLKSQTTYDNEGRTIKYIVYESGAAKTTTIYHYVELK